jgi:hypothetical protein
MAPRAYPYFRTANPVPLKKASLLHTLASLKKASLLFHALAGASCDTRPHEATFVNRFLSQLLEHCPGNTPQVSNWSHTCTLSVQAFPQNPLMSIYSVRMGSLVRDAQTICLSSVCFSLTEIRTRSHLLGPTGTTLAPFKD